MVREERLLTPGRGGAQADRRSRRRGSGSPTAACSAPGARADVTVFDPARFAERGTTFEPNQLATGVAHVLVNGVHTLRDGELTGERGGQVLRR